MDRLQRSFPCNDVRRVLSNTDMPGFGPLVGSIDEGTSSARFILFRAGTSEIVASHQQPLSQIYPQEGWVEQDPAEILAVVRTCVARTIERLLELGGSVSDVVAVGVTNQRESTILWDGQTGLPLHNSIVWLDVRTSSTVEELLDRVPNKTRNVNYLKPLCGLPLSPYFSGVKARWLKKNVKEVARAMETGRCRFGTVDSWLIWNLTGGLNGGVHVTDVTNASRTMLMNIDTLEWDGVLLDFFGLRRDILPEIRSSSEIYGTFSEGPLKGIPICGCLGDQQAALVGQRCLFRGEAKATYGTGCFLLFNTGLARVESAHGLLTTVAYQIGPESAPVYALEGSVAVAGAAIQWLKDNIEIVDDVRDVETIAAGIDDTDVYFVPAFSGLYAPYWQKDARGTYVRRSDHLRTVTFRSFQSDLRHTRGHDVGGHSPSGARGGLLPDARHPRGDEQGLRSAARQAESRRRDDRQRSLDATPVRSDRHTVVRPDMAETTALGAAIVAGVAVGAWDLNEPVDLSTTTFAPKRTDDERDVRYTKWKMAIERSTGWDV